MVFAGARPWAVTTTLCRLGACLGMALGCTTKQIDSREVDALIIRDLPVGTSYDRALAVLTARQIEHSAYDRKARLIRGAFRKTETGFLYTRDILFRLEFDTTGRLVRHTVEVVTEGP